MQTIYFPTDSYHTKEDTPRLLLDRLLLNSRWLFMGKYLSVILGSRKLALKGQYDTSAWAAASLAIFRIIENCGGRFHITGLNNLHHLQSPVVFVSNHMSTLETMIFPAIIAPVREATFVVKESLVTHPIFGPVMRARRPIVVGRSNSRKDFEKVMNEGAEMLDRGISIIIFPQSTRSVEFREKEFNSLGVKLAGKAKVPVLPVAVKTDFWGNGKYLKELGRIDRRKPIYMAFGKPLDVIGSGKEENRKIIEFITSNLLKWNKEAV